jgi:DNA-directed RNA polymerase specialized sigma24 family protein
VTITSAQRAQILYLSHVEGASVVLIAVMTGLSRSAVRRVLHPARRRDASAEEKAAAMRPSSKGRIERQFHYVHVHSLRKGTS